jgi:very-short-patch-repair endonuclease
MCAKPIKINCPNDKAFTNDIQLGMTVTELSMKYGVCHNLISRWRIDLRLAKGISYNKINKTQFIADCKIMKPKDLSKKYGVGVGCIRTWKRKLCIEVNKPPSKTHEKFIAEVAAKHGDDFTVLDSYINSYTKIRFKHNACGYTFTTDPSTFMSYIGCPKCSHKAYGERKISNHKAKFNDVINRLAKNGYAVLSEYVGTTKPIVVLHLLCGHKYTTTAASLKSGSGCPKYGHIKTGQSTKKSHDDFVKEFKRIFGNEYVLLDKYDGSGKKLSVLHKECGEEYKVTPSYILSKGSQCPFCKTKAISNGEHRIQQYLISNNVQFKRQYILKKCKSKEMRRYRFDFAVFSNNKLFALIEFDGKQHFKPIKYYGGEETFNTVKHRDQIKNDYCKKHNITLIRIPYFDFKNIEKILDQRLSDVQCVLQLPLIS